MTPLRVEPATAGICHVVLTDPEHLNTLNANSVAALHHAFDAIARDPLCRVVVLRSEGKHFCAGANLAGHGVAPGGDGSHSAQDWMATQQQISSLVPRMRSMPQPIIAAVQGAASGGGFALALASDVRVCADDARFNAAFVRVGLSGCDIGVSWLLPRVIGSARAFELLLTGRFVDAQEAARIGLVASVVGRKDLVPAAEQLAASIAANSPFGVRLTKKIMWAQLETGSMLAGIALEDSTQVAVAQTADHQEAVQAFTEHRSPTFTNG